MYEISLETSPPEPTQTSQTSTASVTGSTLVIGATLVTAAVFALMVWFWIRAKSTAGKAVKAPPATIQTQEAPSQQDLDEAARKAANAAFDAAEEIKDYEADDAERNAEKALRESNANAILAQKWAKKLKQAARKLYTKAKNAHDAANAADDAAKGASTDRAKDTKNEAAYARKASESAMKAARKVWLVYQEIQSLHGFKSEPPPWENEPWVKQ